MSAELFDYGIQNENSDIRAHVGIYSRKVFVFRTKEGIRAINEFKPETRPAFQKGVEGKTAEGYPVKIKWIHDIRTISIPTWPQFEFWDDSWSTSKRGQFAVDIICCLMQRGRFPLWIDVSEDDRQSIQLSGTDIVIFAKKRIQVKCDARAGDPSDDPRCTGNLFLQCAERNPLKRV